MNDEIAFPEDLPKHRVYELVVQHVIKKLDKDASVQHNVNVPVVGDDRTRQVDVFVEGRVASFPFAVVVECKHYGKPLDVKDVDSFIGMLDDIRPNMGVLVSLNGFTSGAQKRASKEGRRLNLCSVFVGREPGFSAPIGIGIIWVQRDNLEIEVKFAASGEFVGPISPDPRLWQVVDQSGQHWSLVELLLSKLNMDPSFADAEQGTYSVPGNIFRILCTNESAQKFERLEMSFRSKVRFFRRSMRFDSGVAVLNAEGSVLAHRGLGLTVLAPTKSDPWEEVSAQDAKAGLMAELL